MSDLKIFIEMLNKSKIEHILANENNTTTVTVQDGHAGFDGYRGFAAVLTFDVDGKLVSVGAWE